MNDYLDYQKALFDMEQELIDRIANQKGLTWKKIKAVIALDCLMRAI
ncbi:MAG: hypothetical protein J5562_04105 [Clostridia bacterium]|jgi:hypothetical protein|nr:hypothetical protein [Clostridia bacterium]